MICSSGGKSIAQSASDFGALFREYFGMHFLRVLTNFRLAAYFYFLFKCATGFACFGKFKFLRAGAISANIFSGSSPS